ncbi:MAG: trypsin-like peptidase domain-containing protein [Planctomycetota bacterium]|nr:trypsin-like peptidase domain-containing protein [Planctomycetota bacterium]
MALSAEELFKRASPAVVRIIVRDEKFKEIGLGSGFFVSSDGILVTNYHVVAKARFATVVLPSEATMFVEGVLALDEQSDLAVLKVNGKDLPTLNLLAKGEAPAVGARIYAIGNPAGLSNTLSDGLVSGSRMLEPGLDLLQMTAPISPGSSGGPVLDANASVVGVATLGSREGIQNLNFAVPSGKVHDILAKARENKPVPLKSAGGQPLSGQAGRDIQEAMQAIGEERWSDAVRILQELRKTEPANPQVWCVLGLLHTQLGNYDLALEAFRETVRLAPDLAVGHFGMGCAYQSQKRYAEAVTAFQAAIRLSPDFGPAHTGLGMSLCEMQHYAESAAACTVAIRLRPDEARAYYTLALDHLGMGNRTKAIEIYQTLLRLDPAIAADLRVRIYRR